MYPRSPLAGGTGICGIDAWAPARDYLGARGTSWLARWDGLHDRPGTDVIPEPLVLVLRTGALGLRAVTDPQRASSRRAAARPCGPSSNGRCAAPGTGTGHCGGFGGLGVAHLPRPGRRGEVTTAGSATSSSMLMPSGHSPLMAGQQGHWSAPVFLLLAAAIPRRGFARPWPVGPPMAPGAGASRASACRARRSARLSGAHRGPG